MPQLRLVWFLFLVFSSCSLLRAQNPARLETIFPFHVSTRVPVSAFGSDRWDTRFDIINPNSVEVVVSFQAFDRSGQLTSPIGAMGPTLLTIPPNGVIQGMSFQFRDVVFVGWMKVTSTQPVVVQQEISHFSLIDVPGVPIETRVKSQTRKWPSAGAARQVISVSLVTPPVITEHFNSETTGISIVFPSSIMSSVAKGNLVLRNVRGEKVTERQGVVIPANGQLVALVTELFPGFQFPAGFFGSLEFTFDHEVFAVAIHLTVSDIQEKLEEPNIGILQ